MFRGLATAGAALATVAVLAGAAPADGASPECPVQYCTDSSGKYVLTVPPLSGIPLLAAYADCVWDVHVDFGDSTSEDLVFDASVGLTGSHVFPTRGVTYTVQVELTNGHHGNTAEPCSDFSRTAQVRYRTAAEEEGEAPPPVEPVGEGGTGPSPLPVAPDGMTPNPFVRPAPPASSPVSFWRHCRAGVLTHGVDCRKGRLVISRARVKLAHRGKASVAGFTCRPTALSVVCRRGAARVVGPQP
jgi:hypothetical protein